MIRLRVKHKVEMFTIRLRTQAWWQWSLGNSENNSKMKSILFNTRLCSMVLTTTFLIFSSCEDSEQEVKVLPPCQTLNFGVLEVHFTTTDNEHRTAVTIGGLTREKISAVGLSVDTLQLTPGIYSIFINPIYTQQSLIEYMEDTITITQCTDSIITVPF